MMNQNSKKKLLFWSLLLLLILVIIPMDAFAINYGKAMKTYQSNRNMGQEFINFLLILGSMIGIGLALVFLVKVLKRK